MGERERGGSVRRRTVQRQLRATSAELIRPEESCVSVCEDLWLCVSAAYGRRSCFPHYKIPSKWIHVRLPVCVCVRVRVQVRVYSMCARCCAFLTCDRDRAGPYT